MLASREYRSRVALCGMWYKIAALGLAKATPVFFKRTGYRAKSGRVDVAGPVVGDNIISCQLGPPTGQPDNMIPKLHSS